jgi:hypothetical protein
MTIFIPAENTRKTWAEPCLHVPVSVLHMYYITALCFNTTNYPREILHYYIRCLRPDGDFCHQGQDTEIAQIFFKIVETY